MMNHTTSNHNQAEPHLNHRHGLHILLSHTWTTGEPMWNHRTSIHGPMNQRILKANAYHNPAHTAEPRLTHIWIANVQHTIISDKMWASTEPQLNHAHNHTPTWCTRPPTTISPNTEWHLNQIHTVYHYTLIHSWPTAEPRHNHITPYRNPTTWHWTKVNPELNRIQTSHL